MAAALNRCMSCLRWTVFALNLIFWILGLGIFGVALWLRFDPAVRDHVMSLSQDLESFYTSVYLLMAAGLLMTLFGFLGCFGALKLNQFMLTAFFILLLIVFIIQLACGLVAYYHQDEVKKYVDDSLQQAISERYGEQGSEGTTQLIDNIQRTFKCCGVWNFKSYSKSFYVQKRLKELGIGASNIILPPNSCCNQIGLETYKEKCGGAGDFQTNHTESFKQFLFSEGCSDAIGNYLRRNLGVVIGLAVGIGCFQLLGMVLSMMLCCMIGYKKQNDYKSDGYY